MYWEYTKIKGQLMKIPPTKYDVPLLFKNMNSTVQHIISSKTLFSKQYHSLTQYIPHGTPYKERDYDSLILISCFI